MLDLDETIAAVASPPGGAARGIVRVSGPNVLAIIAGLFSADEPGVLGRIRLPTAVAGHLALRGLFSPLPCTLYFWPSSRSYTRQPTAELHTLGSPPLLQAVLDDVCRAGARPARPGEFTLRAFLAGRLDLTQAEAVLGVIDARGPRQLAAALAQLAGGLAAPLTQLRNDLLDLLAHIEAGLDFVDEDIEFISHDELTSQLQAAGNEIDRLVEQMESRAEASDALRAVLIGAANVGKTSLYNALTGQTALVSPQAGTTRDYLLARLDLGGVACELIDTAGLIAPVVTAPVAGPKPGSSRGPHQLEAPARTHHDLASLALRVDVEPPRHESHGVINDAGQLQAASAGPIYAADPVNYAAQRAAADVRERAEIEIVCLDATRPLNASEESLLRSAAGGTRIVVLTKIDQPPAGGATCSNHHAAAADAIETSSVSGVGLDALRARLRAIAAARDTDQASTGTAARCRDSLRQAAAALAHAKELALSRQGEELLAAELRLALDALGQVAGAVYTDDVLDRIFSRFCIGK